MTAGESTARERLEALYAEFRETAPPRGAGACEDVQIDIDEYDGYLSGLVQSYLAGEEIDPAVVNTGDELAARLTECVERVAALRTHLDLEQRLAAGLIECLRPPPRRLEPM